MPNPVPAINAVGKAVESFFKWLLFSQNPDIRARKAMRKEYREMKMIISRVVKYRIYRREHDAIGPKNSAMMKRRKILRRKMESLDADIDRRLDID